MKLESLTALSPIDGRYRKQTGELADYFSEFGLIKYRIFVEIEYFIALCKIPLPPLVELSKTSKINHWQLRIIHQTFSLEDAKRIKEIEATTRHDVKSVEYFLKEKFEMLGLSAFKEFIHFGLTSQDINNTAIPLSIKDALNKVYLPLVWSLMTKLESFVRLWKEIPMLAHTHGQPASSTRVGKEIAVFVERLSLQVLMLKEIPMSAKFGGAVGNFNAHFVAYPKIDWVNFANYFVNQTLGLHRSQTTTQIDHYDFIAAIFDTAKRINTILINLCRDIWTYISMEYFKLSVDKNEVGSSTMPHKVNPIDFENAEGNLGIANAMFDHFASKLPLSRLQRDLTDSTVLRNIGVAFAHSIVAMRSIMNGLEKITINEDAILKDLDNNWEVVSEGIQTILRRENYPHPYEDLKELTRGQKITEETISEFISSLNIKDEIKDELRRITPRNYTGI